MQIPHETIARCTANRRAQPKSTSLYIFTENIIIQQHGNVKKKCTAFITFNSKIVRNSYLCILNTSQYPFPVIHGELFTFQFIKMAILKLFADILTTIRLQFSVIYCIIVRQIIKYSQSSIMQQLLMVGMLNQVFTVTFSC